MVVVLARVWYGRSHYYLEIVLLELVLLLVASFPAVQVVVHDRGGIANESTASLV
jgi:hypothetical protein